MRTSRRERELQKLRDANASERVSLRQIADRTRAVGKPITSLRLRIAPSLPNPGSNTRPDPVYGTWEEFITTVSDLEIRKWCASKSRVANRPRLMSGTQTVKVTAQIVYDILQSARGRCHYCGSLCVERAPLTRYGKRDTWENVGRRIGSLGHVIALVNGGSNAVDNLCWCCMWCNVWTSERVRHANNHGGIY